MINLEQVTFIIPVYIESNDRLRNAKSVLGYLNDNFKTNIIIHELIDSDSKLEFVNLYKNLNIVHLLENRTEKSYHRTRQLNEMLSIVKTKIVCNYDIDVILPINSYVESCDLIESSKSSVVYPYGDGQYQKRVKKSFNREKFDTDYNIDIIDNNFDIWTSKFGHCFFIDTDVYRNCGGENENFIAYGPEDTERFIRFQKFGYRVSRINDFVYHFEHDRTEFSDVTNPNFSRNNNLFESLKNMSPIDLEIYYKDLDYLSKYNFKIMKKNENRTVNNIDK